MMTAPAAQVRTPAQPIATLTRQFRVHLRTWWPLWLIGLGGVWLGTSLIRFPISNWMGTYNDLWKDYKPDKTLSALDQLLTGYKKGYNQAKYHKSTPDTTELKMVWSLATALYLPLGLILLGSGHYLYRHVARPTLFSEKGRSKVLFWLSVAIVWVVWASLVGTGRMRFSPQSYAFGFDAALPTVVIFFWLTQFAITHFLARQREQRTLAQTARKAELAALTAQVNPPFIFHALQHLQATAHTENLPRTEQSLTQLAGIMQYVLEESRKKITDVSREIDFIRDYLRLQELRLPSRDTIQISTSVDWDGKPTPIVPLLLNPLIENAFKYGISMQQACFVNIQLAVKDGVLTFTSVNSVLPRTDLEKGTGLGLSNVRKRLQLAYPNLHKLTISEQPGTYQVTLKIKLC